MNHTNETCDDILRDMFQDHSTDNAAYRIRCYANRWQRALRRERERVAEAVRKPSSDGRTVFDPPRRRHTNPISSGISAAFP